MIDIEKCDVSPGPPFSSSDGNNFLKPITGAHGILNGDASMPPSSITLSGSTNEHEYAEGGLRAYLTVFGAFMALLCTFGQMNSFGTYQTWYHDNQLKHLSPSTISWIGSLQLWVFFFSVRPRLAGSWSRADFNIS